MAEELNENSLLSEVEPGEVPSTESMWLCFSFRLFVIVSYLLTYLLTHLLTYSVYFRANRNTM